MAGLLGKQTVGGLLGGAGNWFTQTQTANPEFFQGLGAGLLSGNMAAGFQSGDRARAERIEMERAEALRREAMAQDQSQFNATFGLQQDAAAQRNALLGSEAQEKRLLNSSTAKWLEAQGAAPELVQMAQAGAGADAFRFFQSGQGGGTEYGLNLTYGRDEAGNIVPMQPGKNGTLVRSAVPEGVTPLGPQDIGFERSFGAKSGAASADQTVSAPGAAQAADNALGLIKSIREDPSLDWGVGGTSMFNGLPGTSGRGFEAKVAQAKGGAFLTAIQQMQGLGALSNNEGAAATSAVTRMDTALSKEDFLAALADYEKIVSQAKVKAEGLMRGGRGAAPAAPSGNRTSGGVSWSVE